MSIGKRLKQLRKDKKLTMVELSNILNDKYGLNLNYTMISKWENEKNIISNTNASAYCKYFEVSLDWLIYGDTKTKKHSESNIDMNCIYEETEFMKIPLYNSISAGYGSCESEFIEMIAVPGLRPNGTTYFAVKVKGDSMEPKIPNGSVIIIKKDIQIENGEIGAFCLNEENLVKQKKLVKDKLILHSFNFAYDDKMINEIDEFKEYGKVVKVMFDL